MTRHFKSWQLHLVILVLATCLLALHVTHAFSQISVPISPLHVIQVHVVDQYSVDYDGVTVQLFRSELVDSGLTKNGMWTSKAVKGGGRLYDVVVFNGEEKTQTLRVATSNVYVEFTMERRSPAPILLVSNVTITPESVKVGGTFNAELKIENVGELKAVTAVLTFNLSYPFGLVASGTSVNIGEVDVGGNRTFRCTFSVDQYAKTGTYLVPYAMSYSDSNHYTFISFGKFGVVVHGIPEIQIQEITVDPTQLNPSSDGILTIQLMNVGTEVALDVTIKILNGEQLLTSSITYVGLIDRGTMKTVIFGIHVSPEADEGIRFLTINISFKDPAGNVFSLSKNFEIAVYEVEPFIPAYYYFFIGGAVAVVIGVYVAVRRLGIDIW